MPTTRSTGLTRTPTAPTTAPTTAPHPALDSALLAVAVAGVSLSAPLAAATAAPAPRVLLTDLRGVATPCTHSHRTARNPK